MSTVFYTEVSKRAPADSVPSEELTDQLLECVQRSARLFDTAHFVNDLFDAEQRFIGNRAAGSASG